MFARTKHLRLLAVGNNAMFFKDMTQWLRNRSFGILFMLLLGTAEFGSLSLASAPLPPGQAGPAVFAMLLVVLAAYLVVLSFQAYMSTGREHADRTFELYEISGMTLEQMVLGKLLSQFGQFCFGAFCIVPFLFIAYILGGLDFYSVLAAIFCFALAAPPIFLLMQMTALLGRFKSLSLPARLFTFFGLVWFIQYLGGIFLDSRSGRTMPIEFLKALLAGNRLAFLFAAFFLMLYLQICLFAFYVCCNAISPPSDTREMPLKILFASLTVSAMALFGLNVFWAFDAGLCLKFAVPAMVGACLLGIAGYYHRLDPPAMARARAARARWWLRPFYRWFAPGARGTLRTLFILLAVPLTVFGASLAASATTLLKTHAQGAVADWNIALNALSMPLSVPFYLAFPMILLARIKKIRKHYANQRAILLAWWAALGAAAISIVSTVPYKVAFHSPESYQFYVDIMDWICLLVSPVSTAYAGTNAQSKIATAVPYMRIAMGMAGFFVLWYELRRRGRLDAHDVSANGVTREAAPAAPAVPPALEAEGA